MALKLDILANTSAFIASMRKAGASVEDIGDALDDMAREGVDAGNKLERSFKDIAREANDAGRKVGREMGDGFDKAKAGMDDFKSEANSTAREAAASFDGSAESIADAFQEVTANALGGFGPAGALAGLAAAAGIGLVVAGFDQANQAAEASEEAVAEWADAYIEAGGKALTAGAMAAKAQDILTDSEKFKTAEENARKWGVSIETAVGAMSGSAADIREVETSVRDMGEALKNIPDDDAFTIGIKAEQDFNAAKDALSKLTEEMDRGSTRAEVLNSFWQEQINSMDGVIVKVDEFGNKLYELPDDTQVVVDAETGVATQNLDAFKGDVETIAGKEVTATVRLKVDDTEWRNYRPHPKSGEIHTKVKGQLIV